MRFLVTNDDGIGCVFLHELVHALVAAGHDVRVAAPRHEQSWVGAAKSRSRPVHATAADRGLGCPTWIVDGTPCDAVNIAPGQSSRPEAKYNSSVEARPIRVTSRPWDVTPRAKAPARPAL